MSASGAPALTVVCRATFALQPIVSRLADEQEPVVAADVHWDGDPRRSLRAASDLVPYKARADVVLVGHAFAPKGGPARTLVARLVVGALDKSVEVTADRRLGRDGELHEGAAWTRRALWYEGASVGAGRMNPVGIGPEADDTNGGAALPYLQPRGARPPRRGEVLDTACFGPIAPGWPQRAARSPRLGARWASALSADRPLPEEIDPAFFNCAPPDQQLDAIRPDERIVLEHLHPSHARVVTSLPGIAPRATIARVGRPPAPLPLVCDTLWIDTDRALCALVFRGTVPLAYPHEPGCVTVIAEVPDAAADTDTDRTMAPSSKAGLAAPVPFPAAPPRAEPPPARLSSTGVGLPFQPSAPPAATPPLPTPPLAAAPVAPPAFASTGSFEAAPAPVPPAFASTGSFEAAPAPVPPAFASTGSFEAAPAPVPPAFASTGSFEAAPPPIVSAPPEVTPWAAPTGAPAQTGSIGQRLAVEQGMIDADAARRARTGPDVPTLGSLAADSAPSEPLSPSAGTPLSTAEAITAGAPPGELEIEGGHEVITAVWSEGDLVAALRRDPRWRGTIERIEAEIEEGEDAPAALGEEAPGLWISLLARSEPVAPTAMRVALAAAVRPDRSLDHPLAVAEGVLTCSFDERERLRVLASAALALDPEDEGLARAVEAARAALADPSLPAAIAERLSVSVRAAFAASERALGVRELDALVERALVEQRAHARREVLAGPHVRAQLVIEGEPAIVVYLPEECARSLPLARAIRARLLVEVRAREDEREASLLSLRARALARIHRIPFD